MLPFHRYTSKDGLVADRITAIQQDEDGVMWFGSYFGLGRYDGINFQKINLPFEQQNKYVTSILPLAKKLYAGFIFGGGLAEYSRGSVRAYSLLTTDANTSNDVLAIGKYDDSSVLVANGKNEIYRFCNGRFTLLASLQGLLTFPAIRHLLRDSLNHIWVSSEQGLFVIENNKEKKILKFFPGSNIVSFVKSPEGKFWIAFYDASNGRVFSFDGLNGNQLKNQHNVLDLPGLSLPGFQGNMNGGFWVVHRDLGLFNISSTGKVKNFPSALNMNADVKALFADRENNLWIANDPGLIKISNFSSVSWYFNEPAAAGGFILRDTGGVTWVNNAKELYRVRNDSMEKMNFRGNMGGYIGKMLFDSSHSLWMVRWDEGIWKTKWKNGEFLSRKYFNTYKNKKLVAGAFASDATGNIWLGAANGIFRMKNDHVVEQYRPTDAQGSEYFVNVVIADTKKQIIWLGDNAKGVVRVKYRANANGTYQYTVEKAFGPKEGLKDTYVRSMILDHNGDLFIGTRAGGVYKLSTATERIQPFSPPGGISCSRITAIVEENTEALWLASCDGIYRYAYATKQWQHFTVADGLPSAEVFHIAVDAEKQQVWAQTEQGVTRIDFQISDHRSVDPLVHLVEVNVLGEADTSALFRKTTVNYEYGNNSIGFVFAASSFLNEKKVRYKYMLEGYEKQWSEPVTTNAVNYASLPPGDYTFQVIAENARGLWSKEPALFKFRIILPFYRSAWFIAGCVILLAALFYVIRVDRLKHQYEVEKIRLRIARDLHDDVGSALGSINLMSETANRRLSKAVTNTEVASVFNKIGQSAQTTLESMDDIIWSINPDKDKFGDLLVRMREFAIPLLEAKDISFIFKVNASDYRKLPMNMRKNVFLLFKEAIFNVIKHADCTEVDILTEVKNNFFHLRVVDNGKGFDPELPSERNGLRNMRKRSELLNGALVIKSHSPGGTFMDFHCNIK
jgi:signal transduction histidine kinase/ligand-binding sensor domain-containing protein